jgi:hypothetical protein
MVRKQTPRPRATTDRALLFFRLQMLPERYSPENPPSGSKRREHCPRPCIKEVGQVVRGRFVLPEIDPF